MMDRSIIHLNVADFAVAVEREMDCRLKDRPVIIAPQGAARAVVYDMSEEAYQAGVRKGMTLRRARRRCGDARILSPHSDRYERAMTALLKRAIPYSPLIEPGEGDGHLFVDVTGTSRLFGPPMDVAWRIRNQAKRELGLDPIWAVASNKLVAKVATRMVKPAGEYIVAGGEEESLLSPMPLRLIPGIKSHELNRLGEFNLTRACEVSALSLAQLAIPFGNRAPFIHETVRGIDPSPVMPVGAKSPRAVADYEFGNDTNDTSVLEGKLYALVEQVGARMRQRRLAPQRLHITVDYSDGIRCIRRKAVIPPSADDITLFTLAQATLTAALSRRIRVRYMRLICDRLVFPPVQMSLFAHEQKKAKKSRGIITAIDNIRHRFGPQAIGFGRSSAV